MISRKLFLSAALTGVFLVFLFFMHSPTAHAYSFDPSNLIGDSVYENDNSMTAAQIDAFLNTFPNSCISTNNGFSTPDPNGWSASNPANHGYTFGADVSAGQAIWHVSQIYHLNPQVILATLQKEQSVVSGSAGCHYTNPSPGEACPNSYGGGCVYIAMSYACPGGCDYSYNGFSLQLIAGAWLLRFAEERAYGTLTGYAGHDAGDENIYYGGPMTATGWARREASSSSCPPASSICGYFDGTYTPSGSGTISIDDGATAALYYYTPFVSGNQKFDNIFVSWFGSIVGSDLVRTVDNGTVYVVSGDNVYPIQDQSVLNDFSALGPITFVPDSFISAETIGPVMTHMVGSPEGTLYFVDAGIKLPFTSCSEGTPGVSNASVADYGYTCSSVNYLTDFQLNELANGPDMTPYYQSVTGGPLFYVVNGQKEQAFDQQSLNNVGLTGTANDLLYAGLEYLPYGAPIIRNGVIAVDYSNSQMYYYENNAFTQLSGDVASLPSLNVFPHAYLDDASIALVSQNPAFYGFITNSGGTIHDILTANGTVALNSPSQWTTSFTTMSSSFISALPTDSTDPVNNMLVKSPSNSTVYVISNATKRAIPSWADLVDLNISPFTINTVSDASLSQVTNGAFIYGPGSLVKTASSGTVYVVESANELYPITSFIYPSDLGLSPTIETMSSSDFSAYTVGGNIQTEVQCGSNYYIGTDGEDYLVSGSMMTTYGFNTGNFVAGGGICASLPISSQALGQFILTSNGTIYYVTGGAKEAIVGYNVYLAHGGNSSNTIPVSNYFAGLIPNGSNLTS